MGIRVRISPTRELWFSRRKNITTIKDMRLRRPKGEEAYWTPVNEATMPQASSDTLVLIMDDARVFFDRLGKPYDPRG